MGSNKITPRHNIGRKKGSLPSGKIIPRHNIGRKKTSLTSGKITPKSPKKKIPLKYKIIGFIVTIVTKNK